MTHPRMNVVLGISRPGHRRDRRSERPCADGGFRAGRRCWSCPAGVPSRGGTAGQGRTVWSTTTNRKGRSVERQPECRGRLVWRTRRRWGRSVSVVAPGAPGGGALARADHVRMGVDARPRANPPLRSATPGHVHEAPAIETVTTAGTDPPRRACLTTGSPGRPLGWRGSPREAEGEPCTCSPSFLPECFQLNHAPLRNGAQAPAAKRATS